MESFFHSLVKGTKQGQGELSGDTLALHAYTTIFLSRGRPMLYTYIFICTDGKDNLNRFKAEA